MTLLSSHFSFAGLKKKKGGGGGGRVAAAAAAKTVFPMATPSFHGGLFAFLNQPLVT